MRMCVGGTGEGGLKAVCVCERAIGYTTCLERLKIPQQRPWPTHRVRQLCQGPCSKGNPCCRPGTQPLGCGFHGRSLCLLLVAKGLWIHADMHRC